MIRRRRRRSPAARNIAIAGAFALTTIVVAIVLGTRGPKKTHEQQATPAAAPSSRPADQSSSSFAPGHTVRISGVFKGQVSFDPDSDGIAALTDRPDTPYRPIVILHCPRGITAYCYLPKKRRSEQPAILQRASIPTIRTREDGSTVVESNECWLTFEGTVTLSVNKDVFLEDCQLLTK